MKISEVIGRKARKALRTKRRESSKTSDPWLLGDEAWHEGKPEDANPFPDGTEDFLDWRKGWQEAQSTRTPA